MHPFEKSGLGKAPFQFIGAYEDRGPHRSVGPGGVTIEVGSPGQPMGTCDHCGTGIATCCKIRSADGKTFIVGSSCVMKTAQEAGDTCMEKQVKKMLRDEQLKRERARITEAIDNLINDDRLIENLQAKPHPYNRPNETAYDHFIWMMDNAGHAGRLRTTRAIEKIMNIL